MNETNDHPKTARTDPRRGLWLTMIISVGLLAGFGWFLNRPVPRRTAVHASCTTNLRQIDGAKDQWAIEHKAKFGDLVSTDGVASYIKGNAIPKCPEGGTYRLGRVGQNPTCSIGGKYHSLPE